MLHVFRTWKNHEVFQGERWNLDLIFADGHVEVESLLPLGFLGAPDLLWMVSHEVEAHESAYLT